MRIEVVMDPLHPSPARSVSRPMQPRPQSLTLTNTPCTGRRPNNRDPDRRYLRAEQAAPQQANLALVARLRAQTLRLRRPGGIYEPEGGRGPGGLGVFAGWDELGGGAEEGVGGHEG